MPTTTLCSKTVVEYIENICLMTSLCVLTPYWSVAAAGCQLNAEMSLHLRFAHYW